MKITNWLFIFLTVCFSTAFSVSCKNKKKEPVPQEEKRVDPPAVEITPDATLQQAADNVVRVYNGITAEVKDGVVTLKGNIQRTDLQELIRRIQELKPRKVENHLVIK